MLLVEFMFAAFPRIQTGGHVPCLPQLKVLLKVFHTASAERLGHLGLDVHLLPSVVLLLTAYGVVVAELVGVLGNVLLRLPSEELLSIV